MGSTEEGPTKPSALCVAPNSTWICVSISAASSNVPHLAVYIHICCHLPTLVNKGTEAGDTGGFLSTAEYGVRWWSSTVVSLPIMTAPQKGQRCPLPHTPPQYPVFITRKRCLMSLPAECTKGTATVNGIPVRLILLPGSSLKPYLSSLPLAKMISQGSLNRKPLRKEKGGRWGGGAAGRERKKMGFTGAE